MRGSIEYHVRSAKPLEGDFYVLSDEQPDRLGDIIEARGWVLSKFFPSALFNHERSSIIGRWEDVKVKGKQLIARLVLADPGTSPLVDMVRSLVRQEMLESVSVGFRAIKGEPIDEDDPWGAYRFTEAELLEASLVSVPANPRARRIVKEFFPDDLEARQFFAVPGVREKAARSSRFPGVPAVRTQSHRGTGMKLSEGIINKRNEIVAVRDKITALSKKIEDNDLEMTDEDVAEQEALSGQLKASEIQLARLESLEADLARTTKANDDDNGDEGNNGDEHLPAVTRQFSPTEGANGDVNPIREAARNARGYDLIVRTVVCQFFGYIERKNASTVLEERYGKHKSFRQIEAVLKATSAPAMTNVVGWAAELVGANVQALLDTIKPVSIYPRIAARGTQLTFDGMNPLVVPSRQYGTAPGGGAPTDRNRRLAGAFVGQGAPIPVRQGLFTALTLNPYKMGVISTFTREMANASTPAMEQIIREAIAEDTAWTLDMALLSDEAAIPGVRPAGIFNGLVTIPPTAAGPDAALTDLKALVSAVIGAGGGRSVILIMNPLQALGLSLMHEGGLFYFRDEISRGQLLSVGLVTSVTVPPGEVYCMDAADFASGTGQPVYDVSDQATLHMDDGTYPADFTAPTVQPIVGGTPSPATPVRSLWQTASIGVRMLMNVSWGMRRPGMVAFIIGVNW